MLFRRIRMAGQCYKEVSTYRTVSLHVHSGARLVPLAVREQSRSCAVQRILEKCEFLERIAAPASPLRSEGAACHPRTSRRCRRLTWRALCGPALLPRYEGRRSVGIGRYGRLHALGSQLRSPLTCTFRLLSPVLSSPVQASAQGATHTTWGAS